MTQIREGRLDRRVRAKLDRLRPTDAPEIVVLPTGVRANGVWYHLGDVAALKSARQAGAAAQFADSDPTYLHEHSAGWAADLALAILGDVRSTAVGAIVAILWMRARQAVSSGTTSEDEKEVPVRLSISRHSTGPHGTETRTLELEGTTQEVLDLLPNALKQLDPQFPELDTSAPPQPDPPDSGPATA